MALRKHEVQKLYLDIQSALGQLIEEAGAVEQAQLRRISVQLLNTKRNMIGTFDEIKTEAIE